MEITILPSAAEVGALAADIVSSHVEANPTCRLGLATGASPLPAYRELANRRRQGGLPAFDQVTAFALDEYIGLPAADPRSFHAFLTREVIDPLGMRRDLLHVPDGQDPPGAGAAYEDEILGAGGIDLQILGIGTNGHLAFNEPGSSLASATRIVTLTPRTRRDNARYFALPEDVPTHAITQGLGTILRSRHVLLIATGPAKAEALAAAVEGPLTSSCPASALQFHPRVTLLADTDAASLLRVDSFPPPERITTPVWT